MQSADDTQLLTEFTTRRSEDAFTTLVNRHINLVYSAALRQVQNPQLAQEVTQVVFIILAQKAHTLRSETILSGWLYRTARFAAANALKKETRRQRREQEAHMQSMLHDPDTNAHWEQISPLLDEAMDYLSATDRDAVLLRYFEDKTLHEVGVAMGLNEDTARKRVSRAVEKLRKFFTKHGTVLPVATLISLLSANSVSAAPLGLASTIAASAVVKGTVVGSATLTLIKGTLEIMAWAKAKTVAAVSAAVIIGGGTTAVVVKEVVIPAVTRSETSADDKGLWALNSENFDRLPKVVLVRPTRFPNSSGWVMAGENMMMHNASVRDMVCLAYNTWSPRAVFETELPRGNFDVLVNVPRNGTEQFRAELKRQFGLVARREVREVDALLLKVKRSAAPGLVASASNQQQSSSSPGRFSAKNRPITTIAHHVEQLLQKPVLNRTGLNGNYDIDLKWNPGNAGLIAALDEKLGLEPVPSRERVELLIVETAP